MAISGLNWPSAQAGTLGPPPRVELNAVPCLPTPETKDTAQCPVLAEPPPGSQLQEDMAGQVGLEPA